MVTNEWHEDGPPVTVEDIAAAERAIGVRFPAALRAFYLEHNGGSPVDSAPHPLGVHGYEPLGTRGDLVQLHGDLSEISDEARAFIPFAYDAGGASFLAPSADDPDPRPALFFVDGGDLERIDHPLEALLPPGRSSAR
ncbi:SMI1/KNR4 family protein [Cellulomonas sp. NPDC089187]|uniref:SMI1/KNR4 family protein n=1 Tax=Cellulomonas sp. NPDC089187 TaxID=3154970 RepID=UPI0034170115